MENNALLSEFLNFKKSKIDLVQFYGEDLLNAVGSALQVSTSDIIVTIDKYLSGKISKNQLVDWVNVVWFTDLFEYKEEEEDSIASVMTTLEALDEADIALTELDYTKMKECLSRNQEYSM